MTHRALLTVAFAAIALPAFAQDLVIRGGTIHTGVEGAAPAEVVILCRPGGGHSVDGGAGRR
jgi:hypothetical protein